MSERNRNEKYIIHDIVVRPVSMNTIPRVGERHKVGNLSSLARNLDFPGRQTQKGYVTQNLERLTPLLRTASVIYFTVVDDSSAVFLSPRQYQPAGARETFDTGRYLVPTVCSTDDGRPRPNGIFHFNY